MDRIAPLEAWLRERPGDRFALYSLALELRKVGRHDEALETFAELLAAHPRSGAGHLQHGALLRDLGRIDAAGEAWRAGLEALRDVGDAEAVRSRREIAQALVEIEDE